MNARNGIRSHVFKKANIDIDFLIVSTRLSNE